MILLVALLVLVVVALLVGAILVVFALLKRLDAANSALVEQAQKALAAAADRERAVPFTMERILDALTQSTAQIHGTIESTVKTVLAPPPVQVVDGAGNPYPMPTMWPQQPQVDQTRPVDPTDAYMPDPDYGPKSDMGYEFENLDNFDPDNPMGIPGLQAPWASPKVSVGV